MSIPKLLLLKYICFSIFLIVHSGAAPHPEPPVLFTCFDGYLLDATGKCVKQLNEEPKRVCPQMNGKGEREGERCRIKLPVLKGCREENQTQTPEGDCTYTVTTKPQYFCPSGFVDDGAKCLKKIPGEIVSRCEKGKRVGNQCVEIMTILPQATSRCSDGATLRDHRCWRVVDVYDCTGDVIKQEDKKGPRVAISSMRHLIGQKPPTGLILEQKLAPQPDASEDLVPVSAPHESRVRVKSQTCEKVIEVAPIIIQQCPDGFMTRDTIVAKKTTEKVPLIECYKEVYSPLITECALTHKSPETCPFKITYVPKQARCKDGSSPRKGICEESAVVPGITYCPGNFTHENEYCVGYIKAPLECTPGLILNEESRCIGKKEYDPIRVTSLTEIPQDKMSQMTPGDTHLSRNSRQVVL